jgi:hypothetical protein
LAAREKLDALPKPDEIGVFPEPESERSCTARWRGWFWLPPFVARMVRRNL